MHVDVATLYIRNVPEELWAELRASALRNGRSLNAEVIARLRGDTEDWRGNPEWWARFEARRARMRASISPDAPSPEELIREDRDSR
jgi:plasmid stability protein